MAADVSSLVRLLNGYKDDRTVAKESSGAKSTAMLMTRDLLGNGRGDDRSLELDLDLQVPTGYEKRLDLLVRLHSFIILCFFFFFDKYNQERFLADYNIFNFVFSQGKCICNDAIRRAHLQ